jgi:hypothetical protein
MKSALKLHNGRHGKRQESFAISTTISAKSQKQEPPNRSLRTPPKLSTNSIRLPSLGKRMSGQKNTKGPDGGPLILKLGMLYEIVLNYCKLLSAVRSSGSLTGPGVLFLSCACADWSLVKIESR